MFLHFPREAQLTSRTSIQSSLERWCPTLWAELRSWAPVWLPAAPTPSAASPTYPARTASSESSRGDQTRVLISSYHQFCWVVKTIPQHLNRATLSPTTRCTKWPGRLFVVVSSFGQVSLCTDCSLFTALVEPQSTRLKHQHWTLKCFRCLIILHNNITAFPLSCTCFRYLIIFQLEDWAFHSA